MERRQKSLYPLTQRNDKEGSSDVTDEPSISPWHWSVHRRLLTADICNDLPDIFPSTELHTRSAIHPGSAGKALENTQPVVSGELVDKCTCLLTHLPDGPTLPHQVPTGLSSSHPHWWTGWFFSPPYLSWHALLIFLASSPRVIAWIWGLTSGFWRYLN